MDDSVKKIIKKKFDSLPESIQKIILSADYEETLAEIGGQYQLNAEQISILERDATLVMMGLIPTKGFETELIRELSIDKLKGSQIVKDINEKIFSGIMALLELMNTPVGEKPIVKEEADWQKNLNFVLSGGDYSVFVATPRLVEEGAGGGNSKENHLAFGTPPQKGGEGEKTPISPMITPALADIQDNAKKTKITDIKSKFNI